MPLNLTDNSIAAEQEAAKLKIPRLHQGIELEVRATPVDGLDVIAGLGFVAEFTSYTNPFTGENFDGN